MNRSAPARLEPPEAWSTPTPEVNMSNATHALAGALDRIASSDSVTSEVLDALCQVHGKRAVLDGLLARCDAPRLRTYRESIRVHRRAKVMRGQEVAHARWLEAIPVRVAAWCAMSTPARASVAA